MSEAERVLAWRPAISLREGLIKTIPYFEQLVAKVVAPPELRRRAVGSLMIDSEGGISELGCHLGHRRSWLCRCARL